MTGQINPFVIDVFCILIRWFYFWVEMVVFSRRRMKTIAPTLQKEVTWKDLKSSFFLGNFSVRISLGFINGRMVIGCYEGQINWYRPTLTNSMGDEKVGRYLGLSIYYVIGTFTGFNQARKHEMPERDRPSARAPILNASPFTFQKLFM